MKLLIAGLLAASTLGAVAPASAQGIYAGPRGAGVGIGGVGVGIGAGPRMRGGYYDDGFADGTTVYEGRSGAYDTDDDLDY